MRLTLLLAALLLATPARADCRCTAELVNGDCPATAEVVCPSLDFAALMAGLQDAEHDRDVCRALNGQCEAALRANLTPEPSPWPWLLGGAAGVVLTVAVVVLVR